MIVIWKKNSNRFKIKSELKKYVKNRKGSTEDESVAQPGIKKGK